MIVVATVLLIPMHTVEPYFVMTGFAPLFWLTAAVAMSAAPLTRRPRLPRRPGASWPRRSVRPMPGHRGLGAARSAAGRATASKELRPIVALTLSEGVSRLLSFVFYLVAARTLTTEGFGVLRYTLALMMLAFGLLAVLVTAVDPRARRGRGDSGRTGAVLGSTLAVAAALLAASLLVCAIASALGLTGSADLLGLLAAVVGYTLFQLYYAISRGLGDSARAVGAYVGGSAAQLAILVLLTIVADPGPRAALLVYAVSG